MLYPAKPDSNVERRATIVVTLLCAGILYAVMWLPAILGHVYTADDLGAFHLPLRHFYATCLASGESFAWWPNLFGGFYALGEGQAGMYHPWHLLLYRVFPLNVAWNLELLTNYPLLFAGTYFFLRRQIQRTDAALAGAALLTFSGFTLLHFMHVNAISVVAHLPWLLLAIDWALTATTAKHIRLALLAIALLTGSQLLLGYPQYVWMSWLIEGGYVLTLLARNKTAMRRLPALALAVLIGVGIGAIQLWPTHESLSLSARSNVDSTFSTSGSLHPSNVVQLVAPYLFVDRVIGRNTHELGLYCGSATLLLVVWLLASRSCLGSLKWLAGFAAGLVVAGLWLAIGQYSSLYPLLAKLPVVGSFRFPTRYLLLVYLGMSLLAAVAIVQLSRRGATSKTNRRNAIIAVWCTVAVSALLAAFAPIFWPSEYLATVVVRWVGPLVLLISAAAITLATLGYRVAVPALVVLAMVDQGVYGLSYAVLPHTKSFDSWHESNSLASIAGGNRVALDLVGTKRDGPFTGNEATASGVHRIDGYAGLIPQSQLDYRQLNALRVAGARWVYDRAADKVVGSLGTVRDEWHEVPDTMPRVRCVTEVVATDSPGASLEDINLETTALVDEGTTLEFDTHPPGTAMLVDDRPGQLGVRTTTPSRQLLVTTERFHPGWQASIAGEPVEAIRVNGDFLGCVVPAGTHDVTFQFNAGSHRYGAVVSTFSLLIAFGAFLFVPSKLFLAHPAPQEARPVIQRESQLIETQQKVLS